MEDAARKFIKDNDIKIPKDFYLIDYEEDTLMLKKDRIYHTRKMFFRSLEWWKKNEPKEPNIAKGFIKQDMIAIRRITPRVYIPEPPEKLRVIRNIKRLIKV